MESLQTIKRRLRGVKNINQITKAMELVAATKMRRSQEIALNSRPYAFAALDLLAHLSRLEDVALPPLLQKRGVKKTAFVVVTSDKGLCGAFNSAVMREFEKFAKSEGLNLKDPHASFIAVGQKSANFLEKRVGSLTKKFVRVGDYTTVEEVRPLAEFVVEGYLNGSWDRVLVFSTHFKTALQQKTLERQILPIDFELLRSTLREIIPETGRYAELGREFFEEAEPRSREYLIEPSPEAVLENLASHLVLMEMYHLVLEANASEHAARRLAMKNASDNAQELATELSIAYNKSRQATITKEIIEVTSGAGAISE